jgi:hypothetical protein
MITIFDAARLVYPNAITIWGNAVNSLTAVDINNEQITITPSVVTNKLAELQTAEVAQEQAQATAKASALAKLTALGLTHDEVTALIG